MSLKTQQVQVISSTQAFEIAVLNGLIASVSTLHSNGNKHTLLLAKCDLLAIASDFIKAAQLLTDHETLAGLRGQTITGVSA